MTISRIKNHSYSFTQELEGQNLIRYEVHTKKVGAPERSHCLVQHLAESIELNGSDWKEKKLYLKIDGRKYKVQKYKRGRGLSRLTYAYNPPLHNDVHLKISRIKPWHLITRFKARAAESVIGYQPSMIPLQQALSLTDPNHRFFDDAFTRCATEAFQVFEKNWAPTDEIHATGDYVIAQVDNNLTLRTWDEVQGQDQTSLITSYKEQLIENFGTERVRYICDRFNIDFNTFQLKQEEELFDEDLQQILSPEVVYRINIGLTKCENHDLRILQTRLNDLYNGIKEDNQDNTLLENVKAPRFLMRNLLKQIASDWNTDDEITCKDFIDWYNDNAEVLGLGEQPKELSQLDREAFNILVDLCSFTAAETDLHHTGRKGEGQVFGYYTHAGNQEYKPWVDEQEFEICKQWLRGLEYQERIDFDPWPAYHEKLAHVISKKHLAAYDGKSWSIGDLVPAPMAADGTPRWYQVTSFINSSTGIVTYTLEPACDDPTLPLIKLCRSRAASPYAMDNTASVSNATNPMEAPGNEGRIFSEKYESELFNRSTIPIWVAYAEIVEKKLENLSDYIQDQKEELLIIHEQLIAATEEICARNTPKMPTLNDIIRDHNSAFLKLWDSPGLSRVNKYRLHKIYRRHLNSLTWKEQSVASQRRQAQKLLDLIKIIEETGGTTHSKPKRDRLKEALGNLLDITSPKDEDDAAVALPEELQTIKAHQETYEDFSEGMPDIQKLTKWKQALLDYADSQQESSKYKQQKSIHVVGHSLGGAVAQMLFAEQTLIKGRCPLIGQTIELFEQDAPGISQKQNETFVSVGNNHHLLFKEMAELVKPLKASDQPKEIPHLTYNEYANMREKCNHSPLSEEEYHALYELPPFKAPILQIHRFQFEGDFFVMTGETHLGAEVRTPTQDPNDPLGWLGFDAWLYARHTNTGAVSEPEAGHLAGHGIQVFHPPANPNGPAFNGAVHQKEMSSRRARRETALYESQQDLENLPPTHVGDEDIFLDRRTSKRKQRREARRYRDDLEALSVGRHYSPSVQAEIDGLRGASKSNAIKKYWKIDLFIRIANKIDRKTRIVMRNIHVDKEGTDSPLYGPWKDNRDLYHVFALSLNPDGTTDVISKQNEIAMA